VKVDGQGEAISLFTGAGGLDYGFEAAGFRTTTAVEMDAQCCETIRANRPDWALVERDIHDAPTAEILERSSLRPGEVDVVIGGPPCQPFSKSGYWRGDSLRLGDPRASTLSAFMRVVLEAEPRAFLLENVAGMAFKGKSEGLSLLLNCVREVNDRTGASYRPVFKVLRAADYGVPQVRDRFFLVAARDGTEFRFPAPTHISEYRTAWDALGDLEDDSAESLQPRGKWAGLLPSIPEGHNYLWHTDRGGGMPLFGWRRRYWSFLLKLAKDRPSWTIQAQPGPAIGPFHWKNRRLSARELCRLQTFPDDVEVRGSLSAVQRQLGNAVPSLLAEVLAREIGLAIMGSVQKSA